MEFLVEFELNVPEGTPESEAKERVRAGAAASPPAPHADDPASAPAGSTNTALAGATSDIDGGQRLVA